MKTRVPGCFCLLILLSAAVLYKNILPLCCLCALILADGLFAVWGKLCLKKLSGSIVVPESVDSGCGYEAVISILSCTVCPYPHIDFKIEIEKFGKDIEFKE